MREILFKAKRIGDDRWIEGYYVDQYNTPQIYIPNGAVGEYCFDCYHIDPNTLCQYTGLIDYDGKKIFENDIIRLHDMTSEDYAVGWHKEMGAYVLCHIETMAELMDLVGDAIDEIQYVEVVGNIFDNTELMED